LTAEAQAYAEKLLGEGKMYHGTSESRRGMGENLYMSKHWGQ